MCVYYAKPDENITVIEQLKRWINGESVHSSLGITDQGTCCPDFSCCSPNMAWSIDDRKRYYDAFLQQDSDVMMSMIMGLLYKSVKQSQDGNDCNLIIPNKSLMN